MCESGEFDNSDLRVPVRIPQNQQLPVETLDSIGSESESGELFGQVRQVRRHPAGDSVPDERVTVLCGELRLRGAERLGGRKGNRVQNLLVLQVAAVQRPVRCLFQILNEREEALRSATGVSTVLGH